MRLVAITGQSPAPDRFLAEAVAALCRAAYLAATGVNGLSSRHSVQR